MNAITLTKPIGIFLFWALMGVPPAEKADVTYVPLNEGQGVFNVIYNNPQGSRWVLQILDQDGNQLYHNIYTDKKFIRNFQLTDPDDYPKLVFVIRNLGDKSLQRFEVESKTHLIEEVAVKEVK